ncbi:MAG: hypothetical protein A2351_00055 [Omnitrophica bacterium RIFOXYB12_FULL_50_7]|nr:MAG: hypothetical protein A2351_00055 [Omnitrophica bacterium RIFOXYB12_FULL_50_7]
MIIPPRVFGERDFEKKCDAVGSCPYTATAPYLFNRNKCGRRDLNPQPFRDKILSLARLH